MTEKMGGAEGTKLDVDFMDMERVSTRFYIFKASARCSCCVAFNLESIFSSSLDEISSCFFPFLLESFIARENGKRERRERDEREAETL